MLHGNKMFWAVLAIVSLVFLPACGGGGGGGNKDNVDTTVAVAGMWVGELTDESGNTYTSAGLVAPDGEIRIFNFTEQIGYEGRIQTSGSSGSGQLKAYTPSGYVWPDGSSVAPASVSFTFTNKDRIDGSYSTSFESGTFFFIYFDVYENPSSLQLLTGVWDDFGLTASMTVNQDGSFSGSDSFGCQYNGTISIVNSEYNLYRVVNNVSVCEVNQFNGLGFIDFSDSREPFIVWASDEFNYYIDMWIKR